MGTSHRAVQLSGPRSSIISEKSSSSTTTMGKGNNEGGFSQEQIDMYKECFKLMDVDKDGTLSKNDLRAAFDNVGKLMDESELDSMLGEVGGSCTFDAMVKMFQEKMAGGTNDPDDLIVRAFKAYEVVKEEDGKKAIEAEMFRHALTHFGDVFSKAEVDDVFNEFEVDDDGYIESKVVIGLFVAGGVKKRRKRKRRKKKHLLKVKKVVKEVMHLLKVERRKRRRRRPLNKFYFTLPTINYIHETTTINLR